MVRKLDVSAIFVRSAWFFGLFCLNNGHCVDFVDEGGRMGNKIKNEIAMCTKLFLIFKMEIVSFSWLLSSTENHFLERENDKRY